jgi:hypothetical protein
LINLTTNPISLLSLGVPVISIGTLGGNVNTPFSDILKIVIVEELELLTYK